ncbi:hypothetical protein M440DRAFT_239883 [Trichoderma longibrachiatum ATCC 18648]|uniref:Uncharacterized protein n=1 Tax=Trichoderma longibrachiatum ATCC 18648 TaxID=983965 RepID=A0A2T4CD74_TRILO|nr:hypothetical protein M440DRAFT_239883 [Trichoderma longibrachiatum ATCC 18648]
MFAAERCKESRKRYQRMFSRGRKKTWWGGRDDERSDANRAVPALEEERSEASSSSCVLLLFVFPLELEVEERKEEEEEIQEEGARLAVEEGRGEEAAQLLAQALRTRRTRSSPKNVPVSENK